MAAEAQEMPYLDPKNLQLLQTLGALANSKPFSDYTIPEQREIFSKVQSPRPQNPTITTHVFDISTTHGEVKTHLYLPKAVQHPVGLIYFVHGGGWIFGGAADFEAFIFDLIGKTGLGVVFPEYTLAPEKKFPVQQEQCLEVLKDVLNFGGEHGLLVDKVVLAGDSSGGQIIAALSILNKQRSLELPIVHQILFHPYIDVTAPLTSGMLRDPVWAEQQISSYFSTTDERNTILGSPGRMSPEEAKKYMPPTTIVIADQDPFKDQDEAFAKLLQTAGVSCGVLTALGSLHDVEMFHQARESETVELIMFGIAGKVKTVLHG